MAGGLLNLVSIGQENIILYGNPQKTYFKSTFKRITNFGLQKFRIDYQGSRMLRMDSETKMTFKIPRYADLLYDSYLVINLPDIWSPLYDGGEEGWIEYGFKWIEEIGSNLLKEIEIEAGGHILSRYTGEYFSNLIKRDKNNAKIELWNRMTGNVPELNDPANAQGRVNTYPNAYYNGNSNVRPSIRGRKLYIPIDAWFGRLSKMAFPLISLQYQELHFNITLRSIRELYTIRDVTDSTNDYPYIAPNINESEFQFWRFLNPPVDNNQNTNTTNEKWNADIHIMSTYIFLSNEERAVFAKKPQSYLIKDVYTWELPNVAGSKTVDIDSRGLISGYMFRFRRSDAYLRNTWSNYSNWPYNNLPYQVTTNGSPDPLLFITGNYTSDNFLQNDYNILLNMGLLLDGKYREDMIDGGIYNYVEKYNNTPGGAKDGLYIYSFALNSDNWNEQPSGAMNMDKFEKVQFQFNTIEPPSNPDLSNSYVNLCDPDGNIIGTRKNIWNLNDYNFDLTIFEERYNVVYFESGMVGLKYAR
jgi:hypothetical protein